MPTQECNNLLINRDSLNHIVFHQIIFDEKMWSRKQDEQWKII